VTLPTCICAPDGPGGEGRALHRRARRSHVDARYRRVLKARLGDAAKKVPTRRLPNWLVRLVALFDPSMKQLLPLLGNIRNATSAKAERVLGWKPRPREDAIVATADSLVKFGIVS
jgi:hypothetical protein